MSTRIGFIGAGKMATAMMEGIIAKGLCAKDDIIACCRTESTKKMVEEGNFGGKGSFSHKATIVGDTVGDPFKDTSGPSLNILIKLMSMVSIVMAGLTVACM